MDLNNAEIAVTTQHLIDIKDYRDYWLHLSDYSDMGEFLSACSDLFPGEKEPEYRYPKWENIPDTLISREWFCSRWGRGLPLSVGMELPVFFIRFIFILLCAGFPS